MILSKRFIFAVESSPPDFCNDLLISDARCCAVSLRPNQKPQGGDQESFDGLRKEPYRFNGKPISTRRVGENEGGRVEDDECVEKTLSVEDYDGSRYVTDPQGSEHWTSGHLAWNQIHQGKHKVNCCSNQR